MNKFRYMQFCIALDNIILMRQLRRKNEPKDENIPKEVCYTIDEYNKGMSSEEVKKYNKIFEYHYVFKNISTLSEQKVKDFYPSFKQAVLAIPMVSVQMFYHDKNSFVKVYKSKGKRRSVTLLYKIDNYLIKRKLRKIINHFFK